MIHWCEPGCGPAWRFLLIGAILALGPLAASTGHADPLLDAGEKVLACIDAASAVHQVPSGLIITLLRVEGGRLGSVSPNTNGTVDIGPMQVNTIWVGKIAKHWRTTEAIAYDTLRDNFCANVEGGAWILQQALDEAKGNIWEGVALYHSHKAVHKLAYLRQVLKHLHALRNEAAKTVHMASAAGAR